MDGAEQVSISIEPGASGASTLPPLPTGRGTRQLCIAGLAGCPQQRPEVQGFADREVAPLRRRQEWGLALGVRLVNDELLGEVPRGTRLAKYPLNGAGVALF
eukprot:CAMPEP_0172632182 /NCGR_PEP_ID=MMETSP1068-20121228/183113_1 /TAXON_ID=35684 /ORGANISM="Pseudopedinella elastica, Strain CCMP716" /LENGTH=101 /DNA_ID=CAMNT_0013443509 /DNA_START=110 /DNA_END=415 /DNA_ORIENTATION=-